MESYGIPNGILWNFDGIPMEVMESDGIPMEAYRILWNSYGGLWNPMESYRIPGLLAQYERHTRPGTDAQRLHGVPDYSDLTYYFVSFTILLSCPLYVPHGYGQGGNISTHNIFHHAHTHVFELRVRFASN